MVHRALAQSIERFEVGLAGCRRPEDRALVKSYLAAMAPALARAVLGEDVLPDIRRVERLLGNSWLIDDAPFEPALALWREFRSDYEAFAVRGMTVNERLMAFELADDYDAAVSRGDTEALRRILETVRVDAPSIERVLAKVRGDG